MGIKASVAREIASNSDDLRVVLREMNGFTLTRGLVGGYKVLLTARPKEPFSSRKELVESVQKTLEAVRGFVNSTSPEFCNLTERHIAELCSYLEEHDNAATYTRRRRQRGP